MVLGGVESPARLVRRARSYVLLANKLGTVLVRDPIVDRLKGGHEEEKDKRKCFGKTTGRGKIDHGDGIHQEPSGNE